MPGSGTVPGNTGGLLGDGPGQSGAAGAPHRAAGKVQPAPSAAGRPRRRPPRRRRPPPSTGPAGVTGAAASAPVGAGTDARDDGNGAGASSDRMRTPARGAPPVRAVVVYATAASC